MSTCGVWKLNRCVQKYWDHFFEHWAWMLLLYQINLRNEVTSIAPYYPADAS